MKAQITRKKINFTLLVFRELGKGGYQQLIAIFNLVKIKNSKDIFSCSKCKVTFGFKYTIITFYLFSFDQKTFDNLTI